ncbi:MAG: hypothetical protein COT24_03380 [Candidatus Kerfeldbacteria bacterium CG08_land_8_20_14_0_20_40_16]|uniref:Uncharacterized protein n=1 Tax=Candidatus Kerfeldbacteria bacterium CG08_land_8_20_14_0_20_40_16 TaxID=2014244 RepID=A0A2H0YVD3_9BACT|nr:MAG: hypothetical protein COT24_03380 [Candidatus Kerfeldbacteria bacterium CG08_land_8_20_14_0_20_40_16]
MDLNFSFSLKKIPPFLRRNGVKIAYLIMLIGILYILFFLYQYLYLPIAEKQTIDPSLIQSKKEVINQQLFEKVVDDLELKTAVTNNSPLNLENPF